MRRKYYEFIVKAIVEGDSNQFHVIGRCGDIPIRIGDRFDCVFCYQPRKYPEEAGRPPVRSMVKEIDLSVVCIHAYQRSLPELGEGMTGSLVLEGVGAVEVTPGWILGRKDKELSPAPLLASSSERLTGD
jgi:hypothetical protein